MSSSRFAFGVFEFDPEALELRRDGIPLRLQSQPAKILKYLIEHADQVVAREDLRRAIWGETTFVDFDAGLNFCMSQLRSALQDDASQATYIRTVPKKGYQFIAPVRRLQPRVREFERAGDMLMRKALLVAATLVVVGMVAIGFARRAKQSSNDWPIVAVSRFDNETGNEGFSILAQGLTDNVVEQLTNESKNAYASLAMLVF